MRQTRVILGVDPGTRNLGYSVVTVDAERRRILDVLEVGHSETRPMRHLPVRRTSDDVRRGTEQSNRLRGLVERFEVDIIAAEMTSLTPYAYPTLSFGIMLGILVSLGKPLIEVLPYELKMAVTGRNTATKRDVIAWALE